MQLAPSGYSSRRSPAGIVVTVALHAALAAAALIGFRVVQTQTAPPPIIITDFKVPTPPPAKVPPRAVDQKITVVVPVPEFTTADTPKTDTTLATTTTADPGTGGGAATGIEEFADIPRLPPGETRGASIDQRYRSGFQPPYPSASQRIGEEGTVVVRVVVGTDGRVVRASVARSSGFARLDEAAVKRALASWRFVPALRDGVPVEAERELSVTFRLRQG